MISSVLFVASNPTSIGFDFARELDAIQRASESGPLNITARWSATLAGIEAEMDRTRPDVVHLVSPGVDPANHHLMLADDRGNAAYASPDALTALFERLQSAVKLVVLNTCHSRVPADAIARHVDAVVAMDGVISGKTEIDRNLDHANVVMLLVSADFVNSGYCMGIELKRALERNRIEGDLEGIPFTSLQWLPSGDKPKPVKRWSDRDAAWTNVAKGSRVVVETVRARATSSATR